MPKLVALALLSIVLGDSAASAKLSPNGVDAQTKAGSVDAGVCEVKK